VTEKPSARRRFYALLERSADLVWPAGAGSETPSSYVIRPWSITRSPHDRTGRGTRFRRKFFTVSRRVRFAGRVVVENRSARKDRETRTEKRRAFFPWFGYAPATGGEFRNGDPYSTTTITKVRSLCFCSVQQ